MTTNKGCGKPIMEGIAPYTCGCVYVEELKLCSDCKEEEEMTKKIAEDESL